MDRVGQGFKGLVELASEAWWAKFQTADATESILLLITDPVFTPVHALFPIAIILIYSQRPAIGDHPYTYDSLGLTTSTDRKLATAIRDHPLACQLLWRWTSVDTVEVDYPTPRPGKYAQAGFTM